MHCARFSWSVITLIRHKIARRTPNRNMLIKSYCIVHILSYICWFDRSHWSVNRFNDIMVKDQSFRSVTRFRKLLYIWVIISDHFDQCLDWVKGWGKISLIIWSEIMSKNLWWGKVYDDEKFITLISLSRWSEMMGTNQSFWWSVITLISV